MVGLRIAVRYLFAKKSHQAVNVISQISVAGVAVATAAIICVLSVFNGFSRIAQSRLALLDPDLRIEPYQGKMIINSDSLIGIIGGIDGVKIALPVIEERVLAIFGGRQTPVTVKGVPHGYENISHIREVIIDGDYSSEVGLYPQASLSVGTAVTLAARPGYYENLLLFAPRRLGKINPALTAGAFRSDTMIVTSVFETGQPEYDTDRIIIPLERARRLLDYDTEAGAIEVSVDNSANVDVVRERISQAIGPGYIVKNRLMQQEQAFRMIAVEKWITFAMLAFVLVIASFNVISTLSMLILEKKENIFTLKSMGATDSMIGRIFIWEGWLISVCGGLGGTLLGLILCYAQQWGGFIKLNGDPGQLSVSVYPVYVQWLDVVVVFALVCLVGFFIAKISGRFANRVA